MAVSVRMEPLLEREIELAAQRRGITKSQFIIDAVERALGRKNSYELMQRLKAEESRIAYNADPASGHEQADYDPDRSKAALIAKLRRKHGLGPA